MSGHAVSRAFWLHPAPEPERLQAEAPSVQKAGRDFVPEYGNGPRGWNPWVGDAGPGPSYIEAGGDKHLCTNKTARYLAHNAVWMARLLKAHPIPTNLRQLVEEAAAVSR